LGFLWPKKAREGAWEREKERRSCLPNIEDLDLELYL
jgi:hypothetical protein